MYKTYDVSNLTVIETFASWTSTNKSDNTSSQNTYTINLKAGDVLKFDWSVSSESGYDWLIVTLDGTEIVKESGNLSGSYVKTFDTAGTYTLVVEYTKDDSQSSGNDECTISNITLNEADITEVETVYNVTTIGSSAFYECDGLTSITIPNSVTSIGEHAFSGCRELTTIIVSDGNTVYDSREGCNAIIETASNTLIAGCQNTVIPSNVTSIGDNAFFSCYNLTSIEIPNSVTSIGDYVFSGCYNLTSITTPNSVTSIGYAAFAYCYGLTSITIPNSVTSIGEGAFFNCYNLTSIEIPNSVTSIGDNAFLSCYNLTSIEIPNSVTSIGKTALTMEPQTQ